MGAFTGACFLAMAGAFVASQVYGNAEGAAAMSGGAVGAFAGAGLGVVAALWLILRNKGHWGGRAVVGLTGTALMMIVCFAYVAFS
jgi:hypothetical protein